MTNTIGGFFGLELPMAIGQLPPCGTTLLRSGRAAVRAILEQLQPKRLLAPFYVCDAALAPARSLGIEVELYPIDRSLKALVPVLGPDDALLVVDYFGLCAQALAAYHPLGRRLIVDQTQALFAEGNAQTWRFTSARKWFGVPDGAFLHCPEALHVQVNPANRALPMHLIEKRWGNRDEAYKAYIKAEATFGTEVQAMSEASDALLRCVDVPSVIRSRRANFERLRSRLEAFDRLRLTMRTNDTPFCYPFLPSTRVSRGEMASRGIFVPQFWSDCARRASVGFEWELELSDRLLPLPVDHRYTLLDMDRVADEIIQLLR